MKMTNLILLSYGSELEYRRAIFCIISFLTCYRDINEIRINLFTDNPEIFAKHLKGVTISYCLLTPEKMEEMLNGSDYIHRRKIAVIDCVLRTYPRENVFFIDSDAFFVVDPIVLFQSISAENSFMHVREYTFQQGLDLFYSFGQAKEPEAFIRFIESQPLQIAGNQQKITRQDYCWNSGVLGLPSTAHRYMKDIFVLNDAFYQNSGWFISEQLAFSIVLDKITTIHAANKYVVHYWGKRQKLLMDELLSQHLGQLTYNASNDKIYRKFINSWKRKIHNDILKEKAIIGLTSNGWKYGLKRALYAIINDPTNIVLFKEVWSNSRGPST